MLKARLAVLYWLLAAGLIVGCAQPMHAVGEQRSAAAGAALGPGDYQIYWIGPAHQEIPTASQLVVDVVSDSTGAMFTPAETDEVRSLGDGFEILSPIGVLHVKESGWYYLKYFPQGRYSGTLYIGLGASPAG